MKGKNAALSMKVKVGIAISAVAITAGGVGTAELITHSGHRAIASISPLWPASFSSEKYQEPEFKDSPSRENKAFNVADFGEQGSNGWFYRYGKSEKPSASKQITEFDGEKYHEIGVEGLEMKKDFLQPGQKEAAILEWRAAKKGKVNLKVAYVKSVNGDKNPTYPDGLTVSIYKGDKLLENHPVDVKTDSEVLMETELSKIPVKKHESIYFVIDAKANNAYDGGLLYAAVLDDKFKEAAPGVDHARKNNNANFRDDFGKQGHNGWYYMCGKDVVDSKVASFKAKDNYMNYTSPGLEIGKGFIHPAINDKAVIAWKPKNAGNIEIRGNYEKFEQHDGNPDWPDGVNFSIYKNSKKIFTRDVAAKTKGNNKVDFREKNISVTKNDNIYFVVDAKGNSSYDGGALDVSILDRNGLTNEDSVVVDESETRQNFANVKDDFGEQGNNGWFFQEGYGDNPFDTYNMNNYVKDDKYVDDSYLEIKRDFVNTGSGQKSAVVKWRVAQDGTIAIDSSYTKLKNKDKNPSWPDGTRVSIFHNSTKLVSQDFAPDRHKEVTKSLDVSSVDVKRGDYISMVVNGKENNAYDGGKYTFAIRSLSGIVGPTEKDVVIPNDDARTNNASVITDFGEQGKNGWFYQYGYYTDPFCAVNVANYEPEDKYVTKDGIEIKRDFIMPSTKDKSANVKWKVAKDGKINVFLNYTKLKNEDKNPSWPDGVDVTLLHNGKVLKYEGFEPDVNNEVSKDMSVSNLSVKKGDFITMIVNGRNNTAYDGGKYAFSIEDANVVHVDKVNKSGVNEANLSSDFGEQGSNGWYYCEGANPDKAEVLQTKTADKSGYLSVKDNGLEIKRDFVQPGVKKHAMYQWVVAANGTVNIDGEYVKFGHQDGNPSWPDGTKVIVSKNSKVLLDKDVHVKAGDGNDTKLKIDIDELSVKKGDILTFEIGARENNAWDGGRLQVKIKDSESKGPEIKPDTDNEANLFEDFGKQGHKGWYYGSCEWDSKNFELLKYDEKNECYKGKGKPELKKDFVEPDSGLNAAYKWIAGEDGKIRIDGEYTKFANDADPNANGVCLRIFHNGAEKKWIGDGLNHGGIKEDVTVKFDQILDVKRGDEIIFAVNSEANDSYDGGKLQIKINPYKAPETPEPEDGDNVANLKKDFGPQGSNGWYFGSCEWDSKDFLLIDYNQDEDRYFSNGKPELKRDFVEPGAFRNAAYKWVVKKDGKIKIDGKYTKFSNDADPNANGVCLRIFHNGVEKRWIGDGLNHGGIKDEVTVTFDQYLDVKKGDEILFAVNGEGNDAWDGGRLEVDITPAD